MTSGARGVSAEATGCGGAETLVEIRGLVHEFHGASGGPAVRALDRIDLDVRRGECLTLVGESGSGKTTLARCLVRLIEPTEGTIRWEGVDLTGLRGRALRERRRDFQIVFQDPNGALNPRLPIGETIAEPIRVHGVVPAEEVETEVARLLGRVGLPSSAARRYPREFSGGERQRIGIARALAPRPRLLIADEPVSALDVSIQAQILNLLLDLRDELGLTLLLIAHDLAIVEQISDRVAVLHGGRLVEVGERRDLFARPQHAYTVRLLEAARTAGRFLPTERCRAGEAEDPWESLDRNAVGGEDRSTAERE